MPDNQRQKGKSPFDEDFIATLIEAVRNNTAPWQKAWATGELTAPYNATKGNIYAGRNAVRLAVEAQRRGFTDPRWATFKQIQEMGGMVRAGERSTSILFFGQTTKEDEKTGEEKQVRIARSYLVWNIEQTNLPRLSREELRAVEPDLPAFAALLQYHNPVFVHGNPSYSPDYDHISMPDKAEFSDDAAYYATVLHEMTHWTGHESRLDRAFLQFGTPAYAHEELVAELSSYMLALEYGLPFTPSQSEAYLQHWASRSEEDIGVALRRGFEEALEAKNYLDAPLRDKTIQINREDGLIVIPAKEMLRLIIPTKPERDEAKAKGALWNKSEKSWQIPADRYLGDFIQWLPEGSVGAHELTLADFRAHATVSQTISANSNRNDPPTWTVQFGDESYFKSAATADEAVERAHQSAVATALIANTPRGREEYMARTGQMSPRFPPSVVLYEYEDLLAQYPDAAPLVVGAPRQTGKTPVTAPAEASVAEVMDALAGGQGSAVTPAPEVPPTTKTTGATPKAPAVEVPPTAKTTGTEPKAPAVEVPPTARTTETEPKAPAAEVPPTEKTTGATPKAPTAEVPPTAKTTGATPKAPTAEVPPTAKTTGTEPKAPAAEVPPTAKTAGAMPKTPAPEASPTTKTTGAASQTSAPTAKGTATERNQAMSASAARRPAPERTVTEKFRAVFAGHYEEGEIITEMMSHERLYLAVSLDERREAKMRGAKWDADNQCWYTDDLKAHPELARYQKRPADFMMSQGGKTLDDFREALHSLGMVTERWSETPNVWHRLPVEGRGPHDKAGAYIIYHNADGTIGAFARNQASGEELRWSDRSGKENRIPQEVQRSADLNSAISRRVNEVARDYVAHLRAEDALKAYKTLEDVRGDEPYFSRKQMAYTHGIKRLDDGSLVVPLINGQRVGEFADVPRSEKWFGMVSMQTIAPDGSKMLMKQAQKSGAYFPIGTEAARIMPTPLIPAEGVATAEAAYQIMTKGARSTRVLAVAGIDSGNLVHVADTLQQMYPEATKILAVDNDIATEQKIGKNPGRAAAAGVAEKYPEYRMVVPEAIDGKNTDWSDVLLSKGTNSALLDFFGQLGIGPEKKSGTLAHEVATTLLPPDLSRLCPREIGKLVFDVTQGDNNLLPQVRKELAAQGYRFDDRHLDGVLHVPVALKDAYAKAVSPLPEKTVAQRTEKEVAR